MIWERWLVFCGYSAAVKGECPRMAPRQWQIQSNSGGRSSASITDPSAAAELICAGLSRVHRVIHFDYRSTWKLLPPQLWRLQSAQEGWPMGSKSSPQRRYILLMGSYTAIEEMMMTEILGSD